MSLYGSSIQDRYILPVHKFRKFSSECRRPTTSYRARCSGSPVCFKESTRLRYVGTRGRFGISCGIPLASFPARGQALRARDRRRAGRSASIGGLTALARLACRTRRGRRKDRHYNSRRQGRWRGNLVVVLQAFKQTGLTLRYVSPQFAALAAVM
jgi:hypothetical protein